MPPVDCRTGKGNSPPARKLASLPEAVKQVRLSQNLQERCFPAGLDRGRQVDIRAEEEDVQQIAEIEPFDAVVVVVVEP